MSKLRALSGAAALTLALAANGAAAQDQNRQDQHQHAQHSHPSQHRADAQQDGHGIVRASQLHSVA